MQFLKFKKISFLFVGALLLAQFGGSACQDQSLQSIQSPDETAAGDPNLPSPLETKDEENSAPAEADFETSEAGATEECNQPSITDLVYDEAGILRSYSEKRTLNGEEIATEVSNIEYDLSDPSHPKIVSLEAKRVSSETTFFIHNIQYDDFHRIVGYEYMDKGEGSGTLTEVFDMVYDFENHLLTEYKVKTTGLDGALKSTFVKYIAHNTLDAEFIILPELGDWIEIYKIIKEWLEPSEEEKQLEKIEEAKEAAEAQQKANEKAEAEAAERGSTADYEWALKNLTWAVNRYNCVKKELEEAQAKLKALKGMEGTKVFEKIKAEVDRLQNELNKADQEIKEAQAELIAQNAVKGKK